MRTKKPSYPKIKRIEVDQLFGQYTYDLKTSSESANSAQNLLLLYGDNGSGKTTIAQLLFHLLSRADVRGHRTYIAQTPFKNFSVTFSNRVTISAFRPSNKLTGPYTLISKIDGKDSYEVQVKTQQDGSVVSGDVDNRKLSKLFRRLSDPPLISYFLSDNRIFQSDIFSDDEYNEWTMGVERVIRRRGGDAFERIVVPSPSRTLDVESSIVRAEAWMKHQALASSRVGEETTSNIYIDILKRIATTPKKQDNNLIITGEDLLSSIKKLHTESQSFVELGLTSQIPADSITKILTNVDQDRLSLIANVLEPYIDSVKARFDALEEIGRLLRTFKKIINTFYKRKTISLTIRDGISLCTDNNKPLVFNVLSSGEKQLLILLCNVLVGTSQPSLFIIDEPEISLNIKWQRKLISSLLELVYGSQVQFVMATHSIELLTQHKNHVVRLEDKTQKV